MTKIAFSCVSENNEIQEDKVSRGVLFARSSTRKPKAAHGTHEGCARYQTISFGKKPLHEIGVLGALFYVGHAPHRWHPLSGHFGVRSPLA